MGSGGGGGGGGVCDAGIDQRVLDMFWSSIDCAGRVGEAIFGVTVL